MPPTGIRTSSSLTMARVAAEAVAAGAVAAAAAAALRGSGHGGRPRPIAVLGSRGRGAGAVLAPGRGRCREGRAVPRAGRGRLEAGFFPSPGPGAARRRAGLARVPVAGRPGAGRGPQRSSRYRAGPRGARSSCVEVHVSRVSAPPAGGGGQRTPPAASVSEASALAPAVDCARACRRRPLRRRLLRSVVRRLVHRGGVSATGASAAVPAPRCGPPTAGALPSTAASAGRRRARPVRLMARSAGSCGAGDAGDAEVAGMALQLGQHHRGQAAAGGAARARRGRGVGSACAGRVLLQVGGVCQEFLPVGRRRGCGGRGCIGGRSRRGTSSSREVRVGCHPVRGLDRRRLARPARGGARRLKGAGQELRRVRSRCRSEQAPERDCACSAY
jgi:hypothetical protein